jgi:hypothetical protein
MSRSAQATGRAGERAVSEHRPDGRSVARREPTDEDREEELIMHLERDQLVAETSRPVPRAALGTSARAGLWALRAFVVIIGAMVIYTFIAQLH